MCCHHFQVKNRKFIWRQIKCRPFYPVEFLSWPVYPWPLIKITDAALLPMEFCSTEFFLFLSFFFSFFFIRALWKTFTSLSLGHRPSAPVYVFMGRIIFDVILIIVLVSWFLETRNTLRHFWLLMKKPAWDWYRQKIWTIDCVIPKFSPLPRLCSLSCSPLPLLLAPLVFSFLLPLLPPPPCSPRFFW